VRTQARPCAAAGTFSDDVDDMWSDDDTRGDDAGGYEMEPDPSFVGGI